MSKRTALLDEAKKILDLPDEKITDDDLREVERLHAEAERAGEIESLRAKHAPTGQPLLSDGAAEPACTMLRTADGREVRAFGRGQRMAASVPHRDGGIDLDGFGRGLAAMITGQSRGAETELRALSEGINTAGGFFVTEQLSAELIDLARARSVMFAAGARVLDMQSDTLRLVTVTGDPSFAAVGENALIPSSDPSFNSILLTAHKHGVLVKVSNELLADAAGAGQAITNALANAWAVYLDGLVIAHLLASTDIGGTGSIGAIDYDDLIDARKSVAGQNGFATHTIMHPDTTAALAKLKTDTTSDYLRKPSSLDDLTMLETTGLVNTSALVGDFSQVAVGQRGNMGIEISREAGTAFEYDQTFIRLLWRGDVGVLRPSHVHELSGLTYS